MSFRRALISENRKEISIYHYIRKELKSNLIVLALIIIGQGCLVIWGMEVAAFVTNLANKDFGTAVNKLIILVIILLIWSLQIYLHSKLFISAVQKMNVKMREDITNSIIKSDINGYKAFDSGTYVSWLANDITTINNYGFANLDMVLRKIIGIIFSLLGIYYFHYSITLIVLILSVFMIYLPKIFSQSLNEKMRRVSEVSDKSTSLFSDSMQGYIDLLLLNRPNYLLKKIEQGSLLLKGVKINYATASGKLLGVTNGQSLLSQVLLLGFTSWLFYNDLVPIGALSGVQYLAATIFSSFTGLSANLIEIGTVKPIFEKLFSLEPLSLENKIRVQPLDSLEIKDLSFKYNDSSSKIINNLSFIIEKGKKYAIIADSGKGKTTLLNIIAGIETGYSGTVKWNGHDYKDLDKISLRDHIMYINQFPHIFEDTLINNITLGNNVTPEYLAEVLADVELEDLIASTSEGLDAWIDNNTKNISGGQRQKIAIARGLILGRNFFILDEVTSSLDKNSMKRIENLLLRKTDVTVLIVNHNLSNETEQILDGKIYL